MTKRVLKIDRLFSSPVTLLVIALLALPAKATISKERLMPDQSKDEEERFIAFLRDKQAQASDPDEFVRVIERLGGMRSVAAVDDLINLITFKRPLPADAGPPPTLIDNEHRVSTMGVYPATGALFHIGRPALPALLKLIETSDDDALTSQNAVYTVMAIFREDPPAGVQYLQSAAEQAMTPEASRNLLRAIARARTLFR